ncbi:hypothetical protein EDB86DRAFT_3105384 [Lactarius hatsudake]|nr:hypothetical protein EDB86DRAFT_3105384 [Lactarius hatsudake]
MRDISNLTSEVVIGHRVTGALFTCSESPTYPTHILGFLPTYTHSTRAADSTPRSSSTRAARWSTSPAKRRENAGAICAVINPVEAITIAAHASAPIIHIHLRSAATLSLSAEPSNPVTPALGEALRGRVDRRRLRGQELVDAQPSIRLAVTSDAVAQGVLKRYRRHQNCHLQGVCKVQTSAPGAPALYNSPAFG